MVSVAVFRLMINFGPLDDRHIWKKGAAIALTLASTVGLLIQDIPPIAMVLSSVECKISDQGQGGM
jgi:hypothetical protein